jgi:hypothetical protein
MFSPRRLEGISDRYSEIDFHDWSLEEISLIYSSAVIEHRLVIVVGEPRLPPRKRLRITFGRVRGLQAKLDLVAKQLCGNDIAENFHAPVAERPKLLDEFDSTFDALKPERPDRSRLKYFLIALCHPSGSIEFLAETAVVDDIIDEGWFSVSLQPQRQWSDKHQQPGRSRRLLARRQGSMPAGKAVPIRGPGWDRGSGETLTCYGCDRGCSALERGGTLGEAREEPISCGRREASIPL